MSEFSVGGLSGPARLGRESLSQIARGLYRVRGILSSLDRGLGIARGAWEDGIKSYTAKMAEYEKLIRAYASNASIEDEFLTMLASGIASAALLQFVTRTLGEEVIGKLAKGLDTACSRVGSLVLHALLPGVQSLVAALDDLAGGLAATGVSVPGLDPNALAAMIEVAGSFKLKLEELLLAIEEMSVNFHEFLTWLSLSFYKLSEVNPPPELENSDPDVLNVAAFLSRSMSHHKVSLLLGRDPIPVPDLPPDIVSETQLPFVKVIQSDPSHPLGVVLDRLLHEFDFGSLMAHAMAEDLEWSPPVVLTDESAFFSVETAYDRDTDRYIVVGWGSPSSPEVVILTFGPGYTSPTASVFTPPSPIVSFSFYTPTQIALLMGVSEDDESSSTALFALLDLDEVECVPLHFVAPGSTSPPPQQDDTLSIETAVPLFPYLVTVIDASPLPESVRSRPLRDDTGYLSAVSGSRGVGAIIGESGEVVLLDIEDDDDDDASDEGDDDDASGEGDESEGSDGVGGKGKEVDE